MINPVSLAGGGTPARCAMGSSEQSQPPGFEQAGAWLLSVVIRAVRTHILNSHHLRRLSIAALIALVNACSGGGDKITGPPLVTPEDTAAPPFQRDMRGLWVATVANIDWPSARTLTADQQRAELTDIIARAAATGINTIVLQVRPAGDAVYQSSLEPWASLLSGTQGSNPGYDPLAFAIQEAHARGLEIHAWINPFRAGNTADTAKLVAPHLYRTRPDLIRVYAGNIWMDPGEPDVRDHSMRVVADIVTRYDIDGIHADDYFYPYVVNDGAGRPLSFPDDATYSKYGAGVPRDDWRRGNIDAFVERMYHEVHAIKPTIKVGISPFGIWRPGNPPGVAGLDAYATIYADSRKWLQQGWVDYLAPQLYWAISAPQQSYPALLDWWLAQSTAGRHVWPGLAAYRVSDGTSASFTIQEIPDQIRTTRARAGASGNLLYNTTATLKRNGGALATVLAQDLYKNAALVPAVPWLDSAPPPTPSIAVSGGTLTMTPAAGESVRWWAVRLHSPGAWTFRVLFGSELSLAVATTVDRILVQATDRAGNVSPPAEWRR